jgi:hypothetical protein
VQSSSYPKGVYCIAELPIENADDFARWLLESYDLDGETVMVAPAADFTLLLSRFKPGPHRLCFKERRIN